MDLQTLATVLTGITVLVTGVGVAISLASFNRTARRDRAEDNARLEERLGARIDGLDHRLSGRMDRLETKIDGVRTGLETKIERDLAEFRAEHRTDMAEVRSSLRSLEQRFYDFLLPRPAPTGTEDA